MNSPRTPNITSANHVQSKSSASLTEPMEADLSTIRTLELLTAELDERPERILPVEKRLVARINSLVGQLDIDLNSPLSAEDE